MHGEKIRSLKPPLTGFLLSMLVACTNAVSIDDEPPGDRLVVAKSYSEPGISSLPDRFNPATTLFVFDIDNTLLESPAGQLLASDQWYKWQKSLLDGDPAKTRCLLDMQGLAYYIAHLNATENGSSVNYVRRVQAAGFDTVAMTARSPQFRSSTERELLRNGFEFSRSLPGGNPGFAATYMPRQSKHNLHPRAASYQTGIAMLAGQHKGDALADLLDRLGVASEYRAVVFFDDDKRNTSAVLETFKGESIIATVIEYRGVNTILDESDIASTVESQRLIEELYSRFARTDGCDL